MLRMSGPGEEGEGGEWLVTQEVPAGETRGLLSGGSSARRKTGCSGGCVMRGGLLDYCRGAAELVKWMMVDAEKLGAVILTGGRAWRPWGWKCVRRLRKMERGG